MRASLGAVALTALRAAAILKYVVKMYQQAIHFHLYYKSKNAPLEDENMFKILIVEDDRDLNRSVCSFLNNSGYDAVGCLDAESAYDEMYKTTFDCIVSDIMMPNIDGFEFATTIFRSCL